MVMPYLLIKNIAGKGRGVFTIKAIHAGTTIEKAPVIVMPEKDRTLLDQTLLHDYIFEWGADSKQCCMALGYVPVYNHSYKSNCEYFMDFDNDMISVKAIRDISEGEEITINYNGNWDDEKPVWFEVEDNQ